VTLAWTKDAPRDDGHYWIRHPDEPTEVAQRATGRWFLPGCGYSHTEEMMADREFWPEPLQPPVDAPPQATHMDTISARRRALWAQKPIE
jgi:hypothetical protein